MLINNHYNHQILYLEKEKKKKKSYYIKFSHILHVLPTNYV
jgi:hypothetical protein